MLRLGRLRLGRLKLDRLLLGGLLFDRRRSGSLRLDVLRRGILRRGRGWRFGGLLRGRLRWRGCGLGRALGSLFGQFGQGERLYFEGIGRVIFFLTEDR